MALSLILEQVVGHFTIDRIADFFFTLVEQLLRPKGGGGLVGYILRIYYHLFH